MTHVQYLGSINRYDWLWLLFRVVALQTVRLTRHAAEADHPLALSFRSVEKRARLAALRIEAQIHREDT
jgi:hypothetical protein